MTKKRLLIALKVAISVGLIWFLLSKVDLGAARDRVLAADPSLLIAAMAVLVCQIGIGSGRWWSVMRAIGAPLPWLELTRLFWIGGFFSQVLPSSAGGDPVRIYMAYKDGLPLDKAFNGVFLERAVTVVALVLLVAMVQPLFLPKLNPEAGMLNLVVLGALAGGAVFGLALLMSLDRLPESLARFRIVRGMHALAADTRRLFLSPGPAALALVFGLLTHVNMAFVVYLLGLALDVPATWLDYLVLMPVVILITTLPISIAGWGVRESAMVSALGLVGVPSDGALVLSISLGVMAIFVMLPAGVIWLIGRRAGKSVSADEASALVDNGMAHADDKAEHR